MQTCTVQHIYKSQVDFEDKLDEHIHRDQISIVIVHDINIRSINNEEDEEYDYVVNVPFELACCDGYD